MSKNLKKTQTTTLNDVRVVTQKMGDNITDVFYDTNDIKVAGMALKAYNTAINCVKTQLIHKKMTGFPASIDGVE